MIFISSTKAVKELFSYLPSPPPQPSNSMILSENITFYQAAFRNLAIKLNSKTKLIAKELANTMSQIVSPLFVLNKRTKL